MELLYADMGGWCPLGRIQFGRDGEEAGGMGLKAANQEAGHTALRGLGRRWWAGCWMANLAGSFFLLMRVMGRKAGAHSRREPASAEETAVLMENFPGMKTSGPLYDANWHSRTQSRDQA